MNLKKQQLVAVSLAVCCAAALPMQAEAKKKENKTAGKPQIVVSSVPQPRAQKQVLVQKTPVETRRSTTANQSSAQVRNVTAEPQQKAVKLDSRAAKKAAKQKAKEEKKQEKQKKDKKQQNEAPLTTKSGGKQNDKAGSTVAAQGAMPKATGTAALPVGYQEIGIFGEAAATKAQAVALLKQSNPDLKLSCSAEEIVDLYWQEAGREGVRQDLAFAQALVETGFFRFGGDVKPEQNNFCGLGTTGGGVKGAHFKTPELGARAHIQHLLAYTTQKHPSTKIIDPRYDLAHAIRLERGLCDTWYKLNGTWAMSPNYSEKIMGVWQRMLAVEAAESKADKNKQDKDKHEQDKKDDKVKQEEVAAAEQHKMRELVDELLKKNK
ncbi:glucosaminidase domain-containing protein [Phascolarctobacterium sp.]|uniref:glucosaminidase domain-containing protein n=1 Tax=Phascolarctobacterium sp. TaxID=2049039 RepID=UPI0025E9FB65|nr:glucosaminidase domain-containing protein [uncultured Phascolarctobacterium sp.]